MLFLKDMKKRILLILQCFVLTLFFSGCWSREEPKNLAMVNSILYDIDENGQSQVSIELINTAQGGGGGKGGTSEEKTSALIVEEKGHFAADTIFRDNNSLEKVIFAGLNKARFFSEKAALSGIHSTLDFIARDFRTDETPFVVVVPGDNPKRIYSCTTGLTDLIGNYLDNLSNIQKKNSNDSVFVRTLDFMKDFYLDGKEPVMGLAQIQESDASLSDSYESGAQISLDSQSKKNPSSQGNSSQGSSSSGQGGSGQTSGQGSGQNAAASPSPSQGASGQSSPSPSQGTSKQGSSNQNSPSPSQGGASQGASQSSPSPSQNASGQSSPSPSQGGANQGKKIYHIRYEGLAAFKGDKLVGYMNGTEARAYNILTNNYGVSVLIAPAGNNKAVFTIAKGKTKIKTKVAADGQFEIDVTIKPALFIRQVNDASLDLRQGNVIHSLEQSVNQQLKNEVTEAIQKAQTQFASDIFGFGVSVHAQHPKEFDKIKDNWNDHFASAKFNVTVESSITREGKARHPFAMEDVV